MRSVPDGAPRCQGDGVVIDGPVDPVLGSNVDKEACIMQATTTPNLAQPRPGALGAVVAAATLAAGLAIGAFIGTNYAPVAAPAAISGSAINPSAPGLRIQRNGETGALTPADRALRAQRAGEIGAGAAPVKNNDSMTYFNALPLGGVSTHDMLRGAGGWWASAPIHRTDAFFTYAELRRAMSARVIPPAVDQTWSNLGYADLQHQAIAPVASPIDPAWLAPGYAYGKTSGGSSAGNTQRAGIAHR
jgi:hypothetical protein